MALLVNGERIEDDTIQQEAERMRPRFEEAFADEPPETREAKLRDWARENVIEKALLAQEARRDPHPVPARDIDAALRELMEQFGGEDAFYRRVGMTRADDAEIRANVEIRLRVDRVIERVCRGLPDATDEAVERYYREHLDELTAPEQIRAAHIVKHIGADVSLEAAQAELAAVREEIGRGADFAEMAAKHSDCSDQGGDLGYFARGRMVEEFEDVVFSLAVGQISEVFPTRFGYHIVKVLDRKAPAPYPLDEVRDHIKERLVSEARNKAIEDHLDAMRAKATIEDA